MAEKLILPVTKYKVKVNEKESFTIEADGVQIGEDHSVTFYLKNRFVGTFKEIAYVVEVK